MSDTQNEAELERLADAAAVIVECIGELEARGSNLVAEILNGHDFIEYDHYPPDDIYDPQSHAQYYFHAHPPERGAWNDYGHFHTFLRPRGMPAGVHPLALGQTLPKADSNDALSHLIGISMNRAGRPVQLFTTNRWVTDETWYAADDVIAMLDHFTVDLAKPSRPLNRWITAMLILFRSDIETLIKERDMTIVQWRDTHPDRDVFEDRALEITSGKMIDLDQYLAGIRARLGFGS